MTSDEQRAYSKGYYAGRHNAKQQRSVESMRRERQAFLDRAFIALLPVAMTAQGWKFGDQPVNSSKDRIRLAKEWAREAWFQRPIAS